LLATGGAGPLAQVAAGPTHPVPQSLRLAHQESVEQLSILAHRKGPVGAAATQALTVLRRHDAREQEFIFPPLTLLPRLAEGRVTPDMAWALPMTDRVRAERDEIFEEHTKVTDALNALITAANLAHDKEAKEFAESAAADSLSDLEILEPTLLLINDLLRSKLPASH
jgi:hypothetical protein